MTKPTKWEQQLRHIVPDSEQRGKVIKFIKAYKKKWVVSMKSKSKQTSFL